MEIRARYVQVGAFTLAVLVAGFAFVYWLNNAGGLRDLAVYRVRFEGSVSGLLKGSAVLFNGIRVGEVTRIELSPADPRQVHATIAVNRSTPVRAGYHCIDRVPGIDGFAGHRSGRRQVQPLLTSVKGEAPLLVADAAASQSMSQAARETLRRLNGILAENANLCAA